MYIRIYWTIDQSLNVAIIYAKAWLGRLKFTGITFLKRSNLFKNQMYKIIFVKEQIDQSSINNKSLWINN